MTLVGDKTQTRVGSNLVFTPTPAQSCSKLSLTRIESDSGLTVVDTYSCTKKHKYTRNGIQQKIIIHVNTSKPKVSFYVLYAVLLPILAKLLAVC